MQPLNFFVSSDSAASSLAPTPRDTGALGQGPQRAFAGHGPMALLGAFLIGTLVATLGLAWALSGASMGAAAGRWVVGLALLAAGAVGGLALLPRLQTQLARSALLNPPSAPATALLELDVVLDGSLRPSVLQAVLGAAMVEAWSMGATSGEKAPVVWVHQLQGAGVAYKIVAQIDPRLHSPGAARHSVLGCVHKHLRFAGLRPVWPGGVGGAEAEQRPRDHQRPDDQAFAIDQVDLFAVLSPFERRMLVSALHVKHLPAGALAVRRGEAGQSMFVVAAGVLQADAVDPDGQPLILGPGQVFGEMSMLTGAARETSVRALFASVLFEVPHTVLAELLVQRPELVDALARAVSHQVRPAADAAVLAPEPATRAAGDGPVADGITLAADIAADSSAVLPTPNAAKIAAQIADDVRQFFGALPRPT